MITIEFSKRIAKEAQKNVTIEDFLLWVNDQCEWYELTGESLEYAINLAKKYYKKFHADTIKIKCDKTEKNNLRYFNIFEVKAETKDGEIITIDRYFTKERAEKCQELYYEVDMYKCIWIREQQVWVD